MLDDESSLLGMEDESFDELHRGNRAGYPDSAEKEYINF